VTCAWSGTKTVMNHEATTAQWVSFSHDAERNNESASPWVRRESAINQAGYKVTPHKSYRWVEDKKHRNITQMRSHVPRKEGKLWGEGDT